MRGSGRVRVGYSGWGGGLACLTKRDSEEGGGYGGVVKEEDLGLRGSVVPLAKHIEGVE